MTEMKIGNSADAPFELFVEGKLMLRSVDKSLVEWLCQDKEFIARCAATLKQQAVHAFYWRDLPEAAKNVLEWMESPNTGAKNVITIAVGERPELSTSRTVIKVDDKPLVVDQALFDTIKFYVQNSKETAADDYPYLTNETPGGRLSIWNDMPECSLSASGPYRR